MPIKDSEWVLMDEDSIAAEAGDANVGNCIYLPQVNDHKSSAMNDRPNVSGRLYWIAVVEGEDLLAGTTGSVVTLTLYNHTTSTYNSGDAILASTPLSVNDTTSNYPEGTRICAIPLPSGQLKAYFGVRVTIGTQTLAAGKVSSWIGTAPQEG